MSFRHRAGLYDSDAFSHFDQPNHGAFFGLGSVVAASVVPKQNRPAQLPLCLWG